MRRIYLKLQITFIKLLLIGRILKNNADRYVNLDFKMLQDLATIDMRLRYLVLHMCLILSMQSKQ